MLNNSPISGESFFEPLPKQSVSIEPFSSIDDSLIWHLNHLFWKHFNVWHETYGEEYEAALPLGVSESHNNVFIHKSVDKFIALLNNLQRYGELPKVIYVLEQGPGTGKYAKEFLDYLQRYSLENDASFYDKIQYLLFDTSENILAMALKNLTAHQGRIATVTDLKKYAGQILFVRHSNLWDQMPIKIFRSNQERLEELYVQPVLDQNLETELAELAPDLSVEQITRALKNRTIEALILKQPQIWKTIIRAFFLKARYQPLSESDLAKQPFGWVLRDLSRLHDDQEFVFNIEVLANIDQLSQLVNWQNGGYLEVVDIIIPDKAGFATNRRPKKYDGSLASFINGPMLKTYFRRHNKHVTFEKIRGYNHVLTVRDQTLEALLKSSQFTVMAEIAASKENPSQEILTKAQKLFQQGIDVVAFSDQALVKTEYFKLAELVEMELFKQLPGEIIMPVMKTRTKNKQEIKTIAQNLQKQKVTNLFVVTGDPSFESTKTLHTSIKAIPLVADRFFVGAVAHPTPNDIPKALSKIAAGAKFLIMQGTYDQAEWHEWLNAVKKQGIHLQVPLIAVVMPIVSHRTLDVVKTIKDVAVPDSLITEFEKLTDEQARQHGFEMAKTTIKLYKDSGIFSGIYIYSKSSGAIIKLHNFIRSLD